MGDKYKKGTFKKITLPIQEAEAKTAKKSVVSKWGTPLTVPTPQPFLTAEQPNFKEFYNPTISESTQPPPQVQEQPAFLPQVSEAINESFNKPMSEGFQQLYNGDPISGYSNIGSGILGLASTPFTLGDIALQQLGAPGKFASGLVAAPFMAIGEGMNQVRQLANEYIDKPLGTENVFTPEQSKSMANFSDILAQFVVPMALHNLPGMNHKFKGEKVAPEIKSVEALNKIYEQPKPVETIPEVKPVKTPKVKETKLKQEVIQPIKEVEPIVEKPIEKLPETVKPVEEVKTVENVIIKEPRSELPKPISDKIKESSENLFNTQLDISTSKQVKEKVLVEEGNIKGYEIRKIGKNFEVAGISDEGSVTKLKQFKSTEEAQNYVTEKLKSPVDLISKDIETSKKIIKDAFKQSNVDFMGLSKLSDLTKPEVLKAVKDVAKYHFENGLNKFSTWARQVYKDVGEWIKPHLRSLWEETKKVFTGEKSLVGEGLSLNLPVPKGKYQDRKTAFIKMKLNEGLKIKEANELWKEKYKKDAEQLKKIADTPKISKIDLPIQNDVLKKIVEEPKGDLAKTVDILQKGDKPAETKYNFDVVTNDAQLNKYLEDLTKAPEFVKELDIQKRQGVSHEQTILQANILQAYGLKEADLLQSGIGSVANAPKVTAFKNMVYNQMVKVYDMAKTIDKNDLSGLEKLGREHLRLEALAKKWSGLKSELGRALESSKIKSEEINTGFMQLGKKLQELGIENDLTSFNKKSAELLKPTAKDKIFFWWYNSMLSNPMTDVANITGNLTNLTFELVREGLSNPKEIPNILRSVVRGGRVGWSELRKVLRDELQELSKFDDTEQKMFDVFQPKTKTGKFIKSILPTTRLKAEDVFFKNLLYETKKTTFLKDVGKEINEPIANVERMLKQYEEGLLEPELLLKYEKQLKYIDDYVHYNVFQQPLGKGGRGFQTFINNSWVMKPIFPFIKIATNIAKVGLRTTPYGLKDLYFKELSKVEKKDVISRALLGSAVYAGIGYLMNEGIMEITGEGARDRDKREILHKAGYKENHIYLNINGEKHGFAYNNINPFNIVLGFLGNASDNIKYNGKKDTDYSDQITNALLGASMTYTDQSFMQGFNTILKAYKDGNIDKIESMLGRTLTPNIVGLPAYIKGDKKRYETSNIIEEFRARFKMGLEEGLKPKLNQFGEPIESTYERFPIPHKKETDKAAQYLIDNNIEIAYPSKNFKVGDKDATLEQYYEYLKESGKEVKKWLENNLSEIDKQKDKNDYVKDEVD